MCLEKVGPALVWGTGETILPSPTRRRAQNARTWGKTKPPRCTPVSLPVTLARTPPRRGPGGGEASAHPDPERQQIKGWKSPAASCPGWARAGPGLAGPPRREGAGAGGERRDPQTRTIWKGKQRKTTFLGIKAGIPTGRSDKGNFSGFGADEPEQGGRERRTTGLKGGGIKTIFVSHVEEAPVICEASLFPLGICGVTLQGSRPRPREPERKRRGEERGRPAGKGTRSDLVLVPQPCSNAAVAVVSPF